jgi:hypothetical protein
MRRRPSADRARFTDPGQSITVDLGEIAGRLDPPRPPWD